MCVQFHTSPDPHAIPFSPPSPLRSSVVKYMRSVKKVALRLVETFADKCDDPSVIATMVSN